MILPCNNVTSNDRNSIVYVWAQQARDLQPQRTLPRRSALTPFKQGLCTAMSTETPVTPDYSTYMGLFSSPGGRRAQHPHCWGTSGFRVKGGRGRSVITQTSDPHAQILSRPVNSDREIFVSWDHFKYTLREVGWWEHVETTKHWGQR